MYKRRPRRKANSTKETNKKVEKKSSGNMKAVKKEVDGIVFASTMEADYYIYLKAEQAKGHIIKFECQPEYPLQDSFQKYGRTIRGIKYIADFKVYYPDGSEIIFDVKGVATDDFKLKRKLFDYKYRDLILKLVIWDKKNSVWADYDEYNKAKAKKKKDNKKKDIKKNKNKTD
jgi:hypothetical protein